MTDFAHVRNCVIQDNNASGCGGGLYLNSRALVSGCIIKNNKAKYGAGIYVFEPSSDAGDATSIKTYAHVLSSTIANNTALDLLEQEGRVHPHNQTVYLDDDIYSGSVSDIVPDEVDSPLDSIIRTENAEATERYIEALPELYREIARKRLVDGMQYKEIADELDIELNTVRTRIRRARQIIDKLSKEGENEF